MRMTRWFVAVGLLTVGLPAAADPDRAALALQRQRIAVIKKITPAVCAVFKGGGGGSGVIIHPDGWVLTNFHVSDFSKTLRVGLPDHKIYPARVVGLDPTGDIALLKLQGKTRWPYAPLGDSDALQMGEWCIAAGNPFLLASDFTPTVTMGVISGVHRFLSGAGGFKLIYPDAIQVDAPINPGNSGGPLFNMAGEVVGINGRISLGDRGRVNIGVGYAISANAIKNLMGVLHTGEIVERGNMDAIVRTEDDGRLIFARMYQDSAAYKAGIRLADELIAFDGHPVKSEHQVLNRIWVTIAGWRVPVTIRREGEKTNRTFWVTLSGIPQRNKKRKGTWAPLGFAWRKQRADALAAGQRALSAARGPATLNGLLGKAALRATLSGARATVVTGAPGGELRFELARVTRGGTPLPHDEARLARLIWSVWPDPADHIGDGHRARGEVVGSGRLDRTPTVEVRYPGPDDEQLAYHYDVSTLRLIGLRVHRGTSVALEIRYHDDRRLGTSLVLASRRTIMRPGAAPVTLRWETIDQPGWFADRRYHGQPLAVDRPRLRPPSSLAPTLDRIAPAVVRVHGSGGVKGIASYGSGVIVSPDGRVVTYNSAMLTSPNLYVVTSDGRKLPARVTHRDYDRDVALLQIDAGKKPLPFLVPAPGQAHVGQWVLAIGNAFNLTTADEPLSLNLGIVSARTRLHARRGLADFPYEGEIYVVDAQINPGAFGGPLVTVDGRWIGLSGKVLDSKETNTQFYYALPVAAIGDLIAGKPRTPASAQPGAATTRVRRVWTGLSFLDAGPFSSPPPFVDRVFPGSPARRAGFRKDDLVLRVDGQRVRTIEEYEKLLRGRRPGDKVTYSVKRGGAVIRLTMTLEVDEDDEGEEPAERKTPTTIAGWVAEYGFQIQEAGGPRAKQSAARKLGRLGKPALASLLGLLKLHDPIVREAALAGIGELEPAVARDALPALRAILGRGRREALRTPIVRTLARLGPVAAPAARDIVDAAVLSGDVALREAAGQALRAIGPDAVPAVLSGLRTSASDPLLASVLAQLGAAAVAALQAALGDPKRRRAALNGLAAVGAPAATALEDIAAQLSDKDAAVRRAAVRCLGALDTEKAVPHLQGQLTAHPADALRGLAQLGAKARAATPVVAALVHPTQSVERSAQALDTLAKLGAPAEPILAAVDRALAHPQLRWSPTVGRALAGLRADSLPRLRTMLAGNDPVQQRIALDTLRPLGPTGKPLADVVAGLASSNDFDLRRLALLALGDLGARTDAVRRAVSDGLDARRQVLRIASVWAAARCELRGPVIRRKLVALAQSLNDQVAGAALRALALLGGPSKELGPLFLAGTMHFDATVRTSAAHGLGRLKPLPEKAIPTLIGLFADPDWGVKGQAAGSLTEVGPSAIPALGKALASPDPYDRFLALTALEGMGPKAAGAVDVITKALTDTRAEIRERAAVCLGRIGKPAAKARKALIAALSDGSPLVAAEANTALQKITGKSYEFASEWEADTPHEQPATKGGSR